MKISSRVNRSSDIYNHSKPVAFQQCLKDGTYTPGCTSTRISYTHTCSYTCRHPKIRTRVYVLVTYTHVHHIKVDTRIPTNPYIHIHNHTLYVYLNVYTRKLNIFIHPTHSPSPTYTFSHLPHDGLS